MTDPDPMPVPTVPGQPGPKLARVCTAVLTAALALFVSAVAVNAVAAPVRPTLTHIPAP